jgi:hypothetical protein
VLFVENWFFFHRRFVLPNPSHSGKGDKKPAGVARRACLIICALGTVGIILAKAV